MKTFLQWLLGFFRDKKAEADRQRLDALFEQAAAVVDKAKYQHFTTLDIFDTDNDEYLRAISHIWLSKEFAFFIEIHKQVVIGNIMEGGSDAAIEGQGILKGIDYIMKNLYAADKKYQELIAAQKI